MVELLRPHCRAVELCGAVRRRDQACDVIEVLAVPIQDSHPQKDMLGNTVNSVLRSRVVDEFILKIPRVQWVHFRTGQPIDVKRLGADTNFGADYRRWDGIVDWKEKAKITIYISRFDSFGAELMLRTGSDRFLQQFSRKLRAGGYFFKGWELRELTSSGGEGSPAYTPTEQSVFTFAGVQPVAPEARV